MSLFCVIRPPAFTSMFPFDVVVSRPVVSGELPDADAATLLTVTAVAS